MPFNENKRLDPSQVQDRRGRGMGRTIAIGGGGIGLVVFLVAMLLGVDPGQLTDLVGAVPSSSETTYEDTTDLLAECQTGADANTREDCRIVGFVNSIQEFWTDEFADHGMEYIPAETVLFSGATQAACGYASGASGPFYCPVDQMVYLDLSFFEEILTKFGAQGGPFAEAYVLAHEYGHHVQNLFEILPTSGGSGSTGPQSMSVFTELQADCLAGIWVYHANETGYLEPLTRDEIAQSLDAAASVGDDRIQRQTQGYVSPEAWTHGSSEQRLAALEDGISSGDITTCDTPGWTE
jgi:predicted metalloprotease